MSDLMIDGFNLALFGMGFVFVFLILLVFLTSAMSTVVIRLSPAAASADVVPERPGKPGQNSIDQTRLVAVISAAIRQHRKNTGSNK